jgi:hypothetical protein
MDLSVAPEIAQFAQPRLPADQLAAASTLGERAASLTELAATPQRWWDRVRFDPDAPVRAALDPVTWLLILPPRSVVECDCGLATLLAGEAAEDGRTLRPGKTRVHARPAGHLVRSGDAGYAVTLHTPFRPDGGWGNQPLG